MFSKSHGNARFKTGALCCVSTLSQCSHFLRSGRGLGPVLGGVRPALLFSPPPCTHRRRPASARGGRASSEDPGNSYQSARLFLIPPCGSEELPGEVITVAVSSQRPGLLGRAPGAPAPAPRASALVPHQHCRRGRPALGTGLRKRCRSSETPDPWTEQTDLRFPSPFNASVIGGQFPISFGCDFRFLVSWGYFVSAEGCTSLCHSLLPGQGPQVAPGQPQTVRNVSLTKQAAILLGVFLLFLILRCSRAGAVGEGSSGSCRAPTLIPAACLPE